MFVQRLCVATLQEDWGQLICHALVVCLWRYGDMQWRLSATGHFQLETLGLRWSVQQLITTVKARSGRRALRWRGVMCQ